MHGGGDVSSVIAPLAIPREWRDAFVGSIRSVLHTKGMAKQGLRGQSHGLDFSVTFYQPIFRTSTSS